VARLPGLVEQGDVRARRRTEDVRALGAVEDRGHRLARSHRLAGGPDRAPVLRGRARRVESRELLLEPGLLLAAVEDRERDRRAARRRLRALLGGAAGPAGAAGAAGAPVLLLAAARGGDEQQQRDGYGCVTPTGRLRHLPPP